MTENPRTWLSAVFRVVAATAIAIVVLTFIAVFFVVPGPMISTAARTGEGMLFIEIDERDAVIIAYDDDAYAGPGTFTAAHEDGRIVDITGLGDLDSLTSEFVFSPARNAIMVNPEEGVVREIVLDTLVAINADASTHDTWSCVLEWNGAAHSAGDAEAVTVDQLPVDGDILGFGVPSGSPPGTPGKRLNRLNPDGLGVSVGAETFVAPGFVAQPLSLEPATRACQKTDWERDVFPDGRTRTEPLGASSGYAVVDYAQRARTDDRQITVVDAGTGEVLGSNAAEGGMVDAATAPSGQAVVVDRFLPGALPNWSTTPVTSTLFFISSEGSMREIVLAPHGWLGLPW